MWIAPWGILGNDPPRKSTTCTSVRRFSWSLSKWSQTCFGDSCAFCFVVLFPSCRETLAYPPRCWQVCWILAMDSRLSWKRDFSLLWLTVGRKQGKPSICSWQEEERWVPPLTSGAGVVERMRRGLTVQHGLAGQWLGLSAEFPPPSDWPLGLF